MQGHSKTKKHKTWMIVLKTMWLSIGFALLVYTFTQAFSFVPVQPAYSIPLDGKVIVIDPGHGGKDGGAQNASGIIEKDITLEISLYLRDFLQQTGAQVIMTRETDRDLSTEEADRQRRRKAEDAKNRVHLINNSDANFLVSIHLNSIGSSRWSGAQTFYNPQFRQSQQMAALVQEELVRNLENTKRKQKVNQDLFILKHSDIPGIIVEAGFLSHPEEAELLNQENYQKKIAQSVYQGMLRHFTDQQSLPQD